MIVFEVLHGTSSHPRFESDRDAVAIGRGAHNDLVLTAYHLSGEHARVVRTASGYVFFDLESTNGSVVERSGVRTSVDATIGRQLVLHSGDLLRLGDPSNPVVVRVSVGVDASHRANTGIGDIDEHELGDRLVASRSIVDLPAVTHQLERADPADALRVYKALQRLGTRLDTQAAFEAVVDATFELLPGATHVAVLMRAEHERDRFILALSRERINASVPPAKSGELGLSRMHSGSASVVRVDPVRASRAVLRRLLADRAAILVANAQEEWSSSESILGGHILSTLAVPLWRGDEIIGLIQADNRHSIGMFDEADLEAALLLGAQAALAIDNASLVQRLRHAEERLRGENVYLKKREERGFPNIIGQAPAMRAVLSQLEKVIATRATVCVEGETGTGKELVASAIHRQSPRHDKMFVAQNCAALPENLLESELFGHKRGAFTSADADKKGLFEIADGGTLFLDEVGEMPLSLQAKLLRVLQDGTIRPVGATSERQVDVRIICATNRDLSAEVTQGRFRQDLFYRLMVFPIRLPPLRERAEDIPALAQHFLRRYCEEYRIDIPGFSPETIDALTAYNWPGNIRELENEVQRVVIQADPSEWIDVTDLSPRLRKVEGTLTKVAPHKGTLKEMMDQVEKWLLAEALRDHGGNKTRTAATLGITREGLHKKLAKFGV